MRMRKAKMYLRLRFHLMSIPTCRDARCAGTLFLSEAREGPAMPGNQQFQRASTNVNPYVPGRTVCRDTFSFGGSGSSRYAWKLKVPACINYVTLSLLPDQTPVTLPATLTVLSPVLSMPFINSPLIPPVCSRHCAPVITSVG
jgi:hypothetical protein